MLDCFVDTIDDIAEYFMPSLAVVLVFCLLSAGDVAVLEKAILGAFLGSVCAHYLKSSNVLK